MDKDLIQLETPLHFLPLPQRVKDALAMLEAYTFDAVMRTSQTDFGRVRNIGKDSKAKLAEFQSEYYQHFIGLCAQGAKAKHDDAERETLRIELIKAALNGLMQSDATATAEEFAEMCVDVVDAIIERMNTTK